MSTRYTAEDIIERRTIEQLNWKEKDRKEGDNMKIINVNDETYDRFINYCEFNGTDESETLKWLMNETHANIMKKRD